MFKYKTKLIQLDAKNSECQFEVTYLNDSEFTVRLFWGLRNFDICLLDTEFTEFPRPSWSETPNLAARG